MYVFMDQVGGRDVVVFLLYQGLFLEINLTFLLKSLQICFSITNVLFLMIHFVNNFLGALVQLMTPDLLQTQILGKNTLTGGPQHF